MRAASIAVESSNDIRESTNRLSSMAFDNFGTQVISHASNAKSSMHHIIPPMEDSVEINSNSSFLHAPDPTTNKYSELYNEYLKKNQFCIEG